MRGKSRLTRESARANKVKGQVESCSQKQGDEKEKAEKIRATPDLAGAILTGVEVLEQLWQKERLFAARQILQSSKLSCTSRLEVR